MSDDSSSTTPEPRPRRRAASRPAGPPAAPIESTPEVEVAKTTRKSTAKKVAATESDEGQSAPVAKKTTRKSTAKKAADTADAQPAAPKRTRKTAVAKAAVAPEPANPAVVLFQAPEITTPPRSRRKPAKAAEPVAEVSDEQVEPVAASDVSEGADEGGDDESGGDETSSTGARRRRRRGGRRRRGRGSDDETTDSETDSDADESDESDADESTRDEGDESGDESADESGDDATSSTRRRRRRRRRGGGQDDDGSSDDPPNTVVRVRTPREQSSSVRGSTRLEAKKQRRRDGREAGRRRAPILSEAEFLARREDVERTMVVREKDSRIQIAVLEDGVLVEHYVDRGSSGSMVGNVYLGRVQNVLPSMEAAFVDIGRGRNAVLYAGEVNWDAAGLDGQPKRIEFALTSGDPVLVQVTKDPMGHKGARLTSQISLAGRYLVYVPAGGMTGISRKLPDTERARLKRILRDVVPEGAGVIVRTAAEGASEEELQRDIARLAAQWSDIEAKAASEAPATLLYGEPDLAIRVVRDIFNEDFTSLVVSGGDAWDTLDSYVSYVAPDLRERLSKWVGTDDVFTHHRVDEQLTKAFDRKVWLPSGGSLVIDRTEAMTVVDVNTGKFTGQGGNLEETVTRNNLEAAEEIVRQLRLRDIGGIIVVDFIDMVLESNRDAVLRRLVECLGRDRTKHQVAEITSLGLVQMTRKRIGQGLIETFSETCESCNGRGVHVHMNPADDGASKGRVARKGKVDPIDTVRPARGRKAAKGSTTSDESAEPVEPVEEIDATVPEPAVSESAEVVEPV